MALIECPECGKKVSSAAVSCIGCGYPIAEYFKNETAQLTQKEQEVREISATISSELRWSILSVYCDDIAYLHQIIYGAQVRIKNYKSTIQKVKKALSEKTSAKGITLDEMLEIRKNGGIDEVNAKLDGICETPQFKEWNRLNDRIGEINDERKKLIGKINEITEGLQELCSVLDIKEKYAHELRYVIEMSSSGGYINSGFLDKMKQQKQKQEFKNKLDVVIQELEELRAEGLKLERIRADYEEQDANLLAEGRSAKNKMSQYSPYYDKAVFLSKQIDAYKACTDSMNEYLSARKKMREEVLKIEAISEQLERDLESRYALNIIPSNYRNLECMMWLSQYISSSQPTDLSQLFALMSLQQINDQMKTANAYLAQIASNQSKQMEYLQDILVKFENHRKEQNRISDKFLAAIENMRQTYLHEQEKSEMLHFAMADELSGVMSRLEKCGRISAEQLEESKKCLNMLSSIQKQDEDFQSDALAKLSKLSADSRYF